MITQIAVEFREGEYNTEAFVGKEENIKNKNVKCKTTM